MRLLAPPDVPDPDGPPPVVVVLRHPGGRRLLLLLVLLLPPPARVERLLRVVRAHPQVAGVRVQAVRVAERLHHHRLRVLVLPVVHRPVVVGVRLPARVDAPQAPPGHLRRHLRDAAALKGPAGLVEGPVPLRVPAVGPRAVVDVARRRRLEEGAAGVLSRHCQVALLAVRLAPVLRLRARLLRRPPRLRRGPGAPPPSAAWGPASLLQVLPPPVRLVAALV